MMYQVIFRPILPGQPGTQEIRDTDGTVAASVIAGSAPAVVSGNNLLVLQALCNNTIQASSAQASATTGLRKYLALIESEDDTSTVETALTAL